MHTKLHLAIGKHSKLLTQGALSNLYFIRKACTSAGLSGQLESTCGSLQANTGGSDTGAVVKDSQRVKRVVCFYEGSYRRGYGATIFV